MDSPNKPIKPINPYNLLITLQGLPAATTFDGISLTTTDPAPIVTLSPIVTPGKIVTLPPIHTLLPIVTGNAHSFLEFRSMGVGTMTCSIDTHVWTDKAIIPNGHISLVKYGEIEIGKESLAQSDMFPIIAKEWLND